MLKIIKEDRKFVICFLVTVILCAVIAPIEIAYSERKIMSHTGDGNFPIIFFMSIVYLFLTIVIPLFAFIKGKIRYWYWCLIPAVLFVTSLICMIIICYIQTQCCANVWRIEKIIFVWQSCWMLGMVRPFAELL